MDGQRPHRRRRSRSRQGVLHRTGPQARGRDESRRAFGREPDRAQGCPGHPRDDADSRWAGIELDKFHTPNAIRFGPVDAPVNTLGIRRVIFAVDDIDAVVARMRAHGAELIGEMQYEDTYRLAYIRGPEGIIVALAEQLG